MKKLFFLLLFLPLLIGAGPLSSGPLSGGGGLTIEIDPIVGTINGVIKANGAGVISAATASDITTLVSPATEIAAGKIRLATDAETVAGTVTDKATTPANITARLLDAGIIHSLIDEDLEPAADTLTDVQCSGGQINNIGQGAVDVNLTLPAAAEGYSFIARVGEPSANYWRFTAATAGTMIVDGIVGKNYAQFSTPGTGNYFVVGTQLAAPQPSGILTGAALAIGGTKTNVASGAFTFYIVSTKYAKAAVAAGTALAAGTIPQNKWGIYRYSIIADGTITSTAAAANFTTGYDTEAAAIAAIPALPASSANMGHVTVTSTAVGGFVGGTSNLDDAGVTDNYYSQAAYTPVYNWIITTGSGTVTTN